MKSFLFVILVLISANICRAQAINLIRNPGADENLENWKAHNSVVVENENGNNVFVLREKAHLIQKVSLPEDSVDKFVVFFGRAASSQAYANNLQTGAPSLYGYMNRSVDPRGGRISAYLSGANMISRAKVANEWNYVWGVFQVPAGTKVIDYFLQGATMNFSPDGSFAKFDDLGLYLFASEQAAKEFVSAKVGEPVEIKTRKNTRLLPCDLPLQQAPKLFEIGLGMTMREVLELFPGITRENSRVVGINESETIADLKNGVLAFEPRKLTANLDVSNVKILGLRFWNGRIYSIQSETDANPNETVRGDVEALIKLYSNKMTLPAPATWETVSAIPAKYCSCRDFEVTFYAAPTHSANGNQISIVDTATEKRIYNR